MNRRQVDPAQLSGDRLVNWYLRTPEELDEERRLREQDAYEAFFGAPQTASRRRGVDARDLVWVEGPDGRIRGVDSSGEDSAVPGMTVTRDSTGSWEEARVQQPRTRTTDVPPPGWPISARGQAPLGPPPADGLPRAPGAPGSFFADSGAFGGDYFNPSWPAPLNRVQPTRIGGQYVVNHGGGRIVSADEVERIYAEQKRRIRGEELAPSPYARAVNRLADGQVPSASQLEKGMWERDPTCHPYGGWEVDAGWKHYPKWTQDYEEQITGARGVDYVVRPPGRKRGVKFDGCNVSTRELEEAKGPGYAGLLERAGRSIFRKFVVDGLNAQAQRQNDVADGRPIVWYGAERPAVDEFKSLPEKRGIDVRHQPARP